MEGWAIKENKQVNLTVNIGGSNTSSVNKSYGEIATAHLIPLSLISLEEGYIKPIKTWRNRFIRYLLKRALIKLDFKYYKNF